MSPASVTESDRGCKTWDPVLICPPAELPSPYEVPGILAFKMRLCQRGDDTSGQKAANQIHGCQQSTPALIGSHQGGVQVYPAGHGQLVVMNKYHRQKLWVQSFKEVPFRFFHSRRHLRCVPGGPLLRKLAELRQCWSGRGPPASTPAPGWSSTRARRITNS